MKTLRKVRYNVATSLDGFIASPDGTVDWIVQDSSIDFDTLYATFDYFVMGRKTYDVMLSFDQQSPLLERPRNTVIVASRSMRQEDYPNITVVSKDIVEYVKQLKSQEGKDIWLMGGGRLAAMFLDAGVIDCIEAAIMPVILGQGIAMIDQSTGHGPAGHRLQLLESKPLGSGILMTRYAVM